MKTQSNKNALISNSFIEEQTSPRPETLQALQGWREALGGQFVKTDSSTLGRYARSTANFDAYPLAVLFPHSTEEVQRVVQIANEFKIPLHTISRGKNWGYGDACAPTPGQAIVDLSELNRIVEVDVELGYVRIESGVSQGELFNYLQTNNIPLWMDATAAGPDASIVGNTLDRGYGHTRYGDRSLTTCGMTVVLPDGTILKTGFSHFENAKAHKAYRNGVGPFIDGLFFQSNYGIVTEMGLWLMPKPEDYCTFFFTADSEDAVTDIVERLAPLKRQGLLPSAIHISSDLRVLSSRTRYPWEKTNGQTPLPPNVRKELRQTFQVHAWTGCGALYGTKETVKAVRKKLKQTLGPYNLIFLDDRKMRWAERLQKVLNYFGMGEELKQKIISARAFFELLKGKPTPETIQGAEWRVRSQPKETSSMSTDPLESPAGLIWVSPVLPMTSAAVREVTDLMETTYTKYGFDTLLTFTMISDRALCCVSNLAYDKRDPQDVARAKDCYNELFDLLMTNGYVPYRTGPTGFPKLSKKPSSFWDFVTDLKQAIDPNNILSPGRYVPLNEKPNLKRVK